MAVDLSAPVLIVDDYNTMIRIIRNLLKQLGFEQIDDACDGSAALTKMRARKYVRHLRLEYGADDRLRPAAAGTLRPQPREDTVHHGDGEIKDRKRHRRQKAGVSNYIVKPFNAQTLKSKIDAVFPTPTRRRRSSKRRPRAGGTHTPQPQSASS